MNIRFNYISATCFQAIRESGAILGTVTADANGYAKLNTFSHNSVPLGVYVGRQFQAFDDKKVSDAIDGLQRQDGERAE